MKFAIILAIGFVLSAAIIVNSTSHKAEANVIGSENQVTAQQVIAEFNKN